MNDRLERLEMAVAALEDAVARQGRRIAALEGGDLLAGPASGDPDVGGVDGADHPLRQLNWPSAVVKGTPSLIGRSLLILAGGFLLRALTESGAVGTGTGVALGLGYGVSWIVAAARAARRDARVSAGFYAACAALIANPLIFEAATEFDVLTPVEGALTLSLITAIGLVAAARWRLPEAAWVFAVGAMIAGAAIAVVRPPGEAATAVVVALGLAVVWMPGLLGWESLRWLTALGADVGVLRLAAMATAAGGPAGFVPPHTEVVAILQGVLLFGYVGALVTRALNGRRKLRTFDIVQMAMAWAIGWGGAVRLAKFNGVGTAGLAALALVVGVLAYAGAFSIVERRQGRGRSYLFLTSLGLVLVLLGVPGLFGGKSSVVWALGALVAAAIGSRFDRLSLRAHAAFLLVAAWVQSGLAAEIIRDLAGKSVIEGVPGWSVIAVVLLTVGSTAVILLTRRSVSHHWAPRVPLTTMLVMSGAVAAATAVWVVGKATPSSTQWMGTVALSAVALAMAGVASFWRVREAAWVVYPLLAVTGLRVLLSDLGSDRTIVLVVALAAYGAALILSPRLLRTTRSSSL